MPDAATIIPGILTNWDTNSDYSILKNKSLVMRMYVTPQYFIKGLLSNLEQK